MHNGSPSDTKDQITVLYKPLTASLDDYIKFSHQVHSLTGGLEVHEKHSHSQCQYQSGADINCIAKGFPVVDGGIANPMIIRGPEPVFCQSTPY